MNTAARRPATRLHSMPFGAELHADGVRFRIWAPKHERMALRLDAQPRNTWKLERQSGGWHSLVSARAEPGTRYQFVLPDGMAVPDPASRYQPEDVHGPSEVMDPGQLPLAHHRLARPSLGGGRDLRAARRLFQRRRQFRCGA